MDERKRKTIDVFPDFDFLFNFVHVVESEHKKRSIKFMKWSMCWSSAFLCATTSANKEFGKHSVRWSVYLSIQIPLPLFKCVNNLLYLQRRSHDLCSEVYVYMKANEESIKGMFILYNSETFRRRSSLSDASPFGWFLSRRISDSSSFFHWNVAVVNEA